MKYCLARVTVPAKYRVTNQQETQYFWVRNGPPYLLSWMSTSIGPLENVLVYDETVVSGVLLHEWVELTNEYAEELKHLSWEKYENLNEKDVLALRIK